LERIPVIQYFAVVRSKAGVIVRTDGCEVAESFEIGSAIQVALIERQDKPETSKHEISPFEVLWPSERLNPQLLALVGARNAVKNVATL
jgi:hypothetical protein